MPIGEAFVILPSVDSTNKYAMREVHDQMATHGTAYFALEQTEGRGQRGRSWLSNTGENLLLSIILRPERPFPALPFLFNAAIALACYNFFKIHAGDETCIKWPNDLYWRDRKAGGILIENSLKGTQWNAAVVGVGININQTIFDKTLPNPVSLRQICGRINDPIRLARELCKHLETQWTQWNTDPSAILSDYNQILYKKNQYQRFRLENSTIQGKIIGADDLGRLIVSTPDEQRFEFGTISWT